MATASRPRSAPGALREGAPGRPLRLLAALAVVAAVAGLLALAYKPTYVNYDARYCLLWARDIVHGHTPDYLAPFAPTPHPLQTLVGFVLLPFGDNAAQAMDAVTLISLGVLAWLLYRIGAELGSPLGGALAGLVVATRPPLDRFALIGYQDLGFAALVALAILLELRRPRRGPAVLAVLAVAGLVRPDAWLLSFAYLAWLWRDSDPRRRAQLAALALAAPVLWVAQDWIITGSPLHSLEGTREVAGAVERKRPAWQIPPRTVWYFKLLLLWPLALGVPLGLWFALRRRLTRSLLIVVTAALLVAFTWVASLAGLSLISRYLVTPAALLTVFYGLGALGWTRLEPGRARRAWMAAGIVALAVSLAYLPAQVRQWQHLGKRVDNEAKTYSDLRLVGEAPAVRSRFESCGTISTIGHRPLPDLRWWLDGGPGSVHLVEGARRRVGPLLLVPRARPWLWQDYRTRFAKVKPPAGYTRVYRNDSWVVYGARARCGHGLLARPPGGDQTENG